MRATLTAKCQLTLPAEIRRRLNLGPGDQLDFQLTDSGCVEIRAVRDNPCSVLDLAGCLGPPPNGPKSLEDMEQGIADGAAETMLNSGEITPETKP